MRGVLLLGGLAVLALPAVYLSRATIVQAEDPPQVGAQDPSKTAADENPFNGQEAEPAALNPFGPPDDAAASPPDEPPSEGPADKAPAETPRAKPAVAGEGSFSAPPDWQAAAGSPEFLPQPSEAEKFATAALDRKVTVDFTETPLADVVDYLQAVIGNQTSIQLDLRALEDAGVGADTPVTRHVKDVKLRTALRLLLDDLDLTYLIRDDVMLITTKDKYDTELLTRTYPIGDLIERKPATAAPVAPAAKGGGQFQIADKPASATPVATLKPTPQPATGTPAAAPVGGSGNVSSGFGGVPVRAATTSKDRALEAKRNEADPYSALVEVITTTIKPQTWDEFGGPGSISVVPVARSLVISQTREVHDEILELLRSLRAAKRTGASN
jgi:general secretion pathway protein D